MPGPHGVISVKGDIKCAYDCDKETCKTADRLTASAELQELKKALDESHLDPIMHEANTSKTSTQPKDSLSKMIPVSPDEPSKVTHVGNSLDPK
jgi:hypothetical protein